MVKTSLKDQPNIILDEYGRIVISDQHLLKKIAGAVSDLDNNLGHNADCSNGYCGHVLACHDAGCEGSSS